jgi:DinB superfamily
MYTDQWQLSEQHFRDAYNSLLELLESMDNDLLNTEMQEGKWSPGQTMAHLHLATLGSLERALKKVSAPEKLKKKNISSSIKGFLLLSYLRSNRKFKAPASTAEVPQRVQMSDLTGTNKTIQILLTELNGQWRPELKGLNIFTHPMAGPIDMNTFYKFLLEHTLHHRRQIEAFLANRQILGN